MHKTDFTVAVSNVTELTILGREPGLCVYNNKLLLYQVFRNLLPKIGAYWRSRERSMSNLCRFATEGLACAKTGTRVQASNRSNLNIYVHIHSPSHGYSDPPEGFLVPTNRKDVAHIHRQLHNSTPTQGQTSSPAARLLQPPTRNFEPSPLEQRRRYTTDCKTLRDQTSFYIDEGLPCPTRSNFASPKNYLAQCSATSVCRNQYVRHNRSDFRSQRPKSRCRRWQWPS